MTLVRKDHRGAWRADDAYDLGNNKQLSITTHKVCSGNLVTTATVGTVDGAFVSHMMFQDFSKCIKMTTDRCTQKNVETQHKIATDMLDYIKESVRIHYAVNSEEVGA